MAVLGLSKQSDATTLNWGKGACKFLRNEFDRMADFFEEPGISMGVLLDSCGISIGFLWDFQGISMMFL